MIEIEAIALLFCTPLTNPSENLLILALLGERIPSITDIVMWRHPITVAEAAGSPLMISCERVRYHGASSSTVLDVVFGYEISSNAYIPFRVESLSTAIVISP